MLSRLSWISYYPVLACFLFRAFLAWAPCNIIEICELTLIILRISLNPAHTTSSSLSLSAEFCSLPCSGKFREGTRLASLYWARHNSLSSDWENKSAQRNEFQLQPVYWSDQNKSIAKLLRIFTFSATLTRWQTDRLNWSIKKRSGFVIRGEDRTGTDAELISGDKERVGTACINVCFELHPVE